MVVSHRRIAHRLLSGTVLTTYAAAVFLGLWHIAAMSGPEHGAMTAADCSYAMVDRAPCADLVAHVRLWQTFSTGVFLAVVIAAFAAAVWSRFMLAVSAILRQVRPVATAPSAPPGVLPALCASGILSPQAP